MNKSYSESYKEAGVDITAGYKAVELMKKYGDIEKVRRALNHNSESVTLIYALADQQLQAKYRRRRASSGRKAS